MKITSALWLFLVLAVTTLNTWAAYMTAIYGWSMISSDAMIVAGFAGVVTFVGAWIIVSS